MNNDKSSPLLPQQGGEQTARASRGPMIHSLKTDPAVFQAVFDGSKTHEIRLNDRDFRVGDTLNLIETESSGDAMRNGLPLKYTGRAIERRVSHVLNGYGLNPDWVILSFAAVLPQVGEAKPEMDHDCLAAIQNVVGQLEKIERGFIDYVYDESTERPMTIKDAKKSATYALQRLRPAYSHVIDVLTGRVKVASEYIGNAPWPFPDAAPATLGESKAIAPEDDLNATEAWLDSAMCDMPEGMETSYETVSSYAAAVIAGYRALVAENAVREEQKPVLYQKRMLPNFGDLSWQQWENCTQGVFDDIKKLGDQTGKQWILDARALFAAPVAQALPVESDSTLPFEGALSMLIDAVVPGLDSGDILDDANAAGKVLNSKVFQDFVQGVQNEYVIPNKTWLWTQLMNWCKSRGVAPANYDSLFKICDLVPVAQAVRVISYPNLQDESVGHEMYRAGYNMGIEDVRLLNEKKDVNGSNCCDMPEHCQKYADGKCLLKLGGSA